MNCFYSHSTLFHKSQTRYLRMKISRQFSIPAVALLVTVILFFCSNNVNGFNTQSGSKYAQVKTPATFMCTSTTPSRMMSSTQLSMVASPQTLVPKIAIKVAAITLSAALAGTGFVKLFLDKPSRTYGKGTVAQEYDEWTEEGILEYYWGEHIHLGYYGEDVKYRYKPLKEAQYAFIDEMMKFGGIDPSIDGKAKVLDVGCGFGGTSRYLARALGPESSVTAITLSPKQVERAQELAIEQDTPNVNFMVEDALQMPSFPDNSFDIVWACESGGTCSYFGNISRLVSRLVLSCRVFSHQCITIKSNK